MPAPTSETITTSTPQRSDSVPQSEDTIAKSVALNEDIFGDADDESEEKETSSATVPEKKEIPGEEKEVEKEKVEDISIDERIERALKEGFEKVIPKPEQQVQKEVQLTPEQEDQLLGRWKPDDKFLELLDNEDPKVRLNAVAHMRDGIIKQALTMTKFLVDQAVEGIQSQVAPINQERQLTAQEKGREAFYSVYPSLKGEGENDYSDFLRLAVEDLRKEGFVPKSSADAMKTIATRAEERIKKFNPKFELGTPTAQTTKTKAKTTMPKQAQTSPGGGGGAASGASSGKAGNRSTGVEVFD